MLGLAADVTEKQIRALNSQRSARELWHESFGGSYGAASCDGHISAFSDPDQSVEYGNPGKSWADLLHDKEREPVLREWQVSLATGQPYEVEARLRQADGAYRCHQCTAVPLGSNGGVRKWLGLWIDAHYNNSRGSGKAHRSSRGGNCEPHVDAELVGEAVGRAKRVIMRRHQAARRVQ
ncbi:hypothetical protein CO683_37925 [Bradyrhizobium ottawaense]|uniref:PAS domain-containing protein n=1 Tax=Bradyrhizobium TaxID=374 RepID=UPI000BE89F18|nr:hypothetical protein CO683_37925 [Bradyrhizobium ottawaense]